MVASRRQWTEWWRRVASLKQRMVERRHRRGRRRLQVQRRVRRRQVGVRAQVLQQFVGRAEAFAAVIVADYPVTDVGPG